MLTKSILSAALVIGFASAAFAENSEPATPYTNAEIRASASQTGGRDAYASANSAAVQTYTKGEMVWFDRGSAPRD